MTSVLLKKADPDGHHFPWDLAIAAFVSQLVHWLEDPIELGSLHRSH